VQVVLQAKSAHGAPLIYISVALRPLTVTGFRSSASRAKASKQLHFPETAQESGGSSPTTTPFLCHSNSPCTRILRPSLALCHSAITGWTAGVDTKACNSHYLF